MKKNKKKNRKINEVNVNSNKKIGIRKYNKLFLRLKKSVHRAIYTKEFWGIVNTALKFLYAMYCFKMGHTPPL